MSKITIYSEACNKVDGFRSMGEEFIRKLVINGKSKSTHQNYLRQMSKLALYYSRNPLELEIDELEEYLYHLIQNDTDSLSSFKHWSTTNTLLKVVFASHTFIFSLVPFSSLQVLHRII